MSPLWISHRGYKAHAAENTLEAFRAAVAGGFCALETDLRCSRDGHLVLHHDRSLARVAGLRRNIDVMNRAELEAVRLSGDQRLLFVEDFIREFPSCQWTFDIKPETGAATLHRLASLAKQRGMLDWIVAQSKFVVWTQRDVRLLPQLFPKAVRYPTRGESWRAALSVLAGAAGMGDICAGRSYPLPERFAGRALWTQRNVAVFHSFGAQVIAFLPESVAAAQQALQAGCDEILTNGAIVGGHRT